MLIALGMLLGKFVGKGTGSKGVNSDKVNYVLKLVQNQYVDSLDPKELQEEIVTSVLHSLDPHSHYIPAENVEQENRDLVGSFVGIGIEFNVINDTPYIVRVMANGPAELAGVRPADRLISADTSSLIGLKNSDIIRVLKGEQNSQVVLHIKRPKSKELQDFTISRNTIPLPSVSAWFMLDDQTGYIKVDRFAGKTSEEFESALKELKQNEGFEQLVIDLRNNGGGYLQTAIAMLDHFFDEKLLLSYTTGKASYKKEYYSSEGGLATDVKLICLVNRNSASASEIFSGAIQDYDRGLVIGEKTFGKGLVQQTFELPDKSQLRLTVSRYYIPSGRCIQKSYVNGVQSYYDEVINRKDTALGDRDSFYFETRNGRKVFGGGGIDPDILVGSGLDHYRWLKDVDFNRKLIEFIDLEYEQIVDAKKPEHITVDKEMQASAELFTDRDSGQTPNDLLLPVLRRFQGDQAYFQAFSSQDSAVIKALSQFESMDTLLQLR